MGLGSSIRRVGRRIESSTRGEVSRAAADTRVNASRFEGEYKRWGRQADPYVKWLGYGMYAGQFNIATREGAKKSGYSKEESESLGDRLGTNYQGVAMDRQMRLAAEDAAASEKVFAAAADREREKSRMQIAVRVRRGMPVRNRVGQTMAAGLGTTGATSGGSPTFASMLGL
jgi:hypothetical protein